MSGRRTRTPQRSPARWLPGGLALLLVLAATGYGWRWLQDPAVMPVRRVDVRGELRHVDVAGLQRTLAGLTGGGFFGTDLARLRQAVLARPWVAGASVQRVWPHRLVVTVREQVPVARWGRAGLVNARGEVFQPERPVALRLPVTLFGPPGSAARVLAFYRQVRARLADRGLEARRVELDRRGEWRLQLAGGAWLVVGRTAPLARVQRLLAVWPVLNDPSRRPGRIDLRYEQGFAVRWRQEEKG